MSRVTNTKILDEIEQEMLHSTIPNEIIIMGVLATAIELMSTHTFRRIRTIYNKRGLETKDTGSILKGLKMYCTKVREMTYWFDREIEPNTIDCTFTSHGVRSYDNFYHSANEVCQHMMLLFDRLVTPERADEARNLIKGMSSAGLFTEEDIEYFNMK